MNNKNTPSQAFYDYCVLEGIKNQHVITSYYQLLSEKKKTRVVQLLRIHSSFDLKKVRRIADDLYNLVVSEIRPTSNVKKSTTVPKASVQDKTLLSDAVESIEELIGKFSYNTKKPKVTANYSELVLSDIHFPFALENLYSIVKDMKVRYGVSKVTLLGDILDCYSISRYSKPLSYINPLQELAQARAFVEWLSGEFDEVSLLEGNHDARVFGVMANTNPSIIPFLNSPIEMLAAKLDNVFVRKTIVPNTAPSVEFGKNTVLPYLYVANNTAYCHISDFCGKDAHTQSRAWLDSTYDLLGLTSSPNLVLQAHAHRLNSEYNRKGQLAVTTGSMCRPMPYVFENPKKFSPPINGCVIIPRDYKGDPILSEIKLVHV